MKKIKTSLLMAGLMAASGFAMAQTAATAPATRAEVKSEVVRPDASVPPRNLSEPPKPGAATATTRAEVKSDVTRPDASVPPRNLSEPPKPGTAANTTRSEVKAGKAAATTPSQGSAKRKMTREERRAMNKSNKDMKMKSSTSAMPQAEPPTNK